MLDERLSRSRGRLLSCARSAFAQSDGPPPAHSHHRKRAAGVGARHPGDARPLLTPYRFVLHAMDGERRELAGRVRARRLDLGGFAECSAPLPDLSIGVHVLRMSAVVDGRESELSDAISRDGRAGNVDVLAASVRAAPAARQHARRPRARSPPSHPASSLQPVVSMRQPISAVAPAGGGRVYFVEGGHYVRVVAGAGYWPIRR